MKKTNLLALQFATNMFGTLKPELIKRVERYLKRPTFDNWDDISSIIIDGSGKMKTIWNAVVEVNPFFPRRGRRTDMEGNIVREWEQKPTPAEVVEAIKRVAYKPFVNHN